MNKQYLNCKKIETSINRAKKMLIKVAKKKGIYENFGQKEVREIKSKFIDVCNYSKEMNNKRLQLELFDDWCSSYTGN